MKNTFEMQRYGVTESAFKAQIRYYMKKHGLDSWIDYITPELGHTTGHSGWNKTELFSEYNKEAVGDYQMYLKPTEEGFANGYTGYNFIYEFHYDDDKTGYGYFYIVDSFVKEVSR